MPGEWMDQIMGPLRLVIFFLDREKGVPIPDDLFLQ